MLEILFSLYNPQTVKTVVLYSLPYVVAFSLASRKNLRIWLATQRAPVPLIDPELVASRKRRAWIKLLAAYSLYFLLLGAFGLRKDEGKEYNFEEAIRIVLVTTIGLFATVSVAKGVADMSRVDKKSVHRNSVGGFVIRRVREPGNCGRMLIKTSILLCAAGLTVMSILHQGDRLIAFLSVFVSYNFVQISRAGRLSFKLLYFCSALVVILDSLIIGLFMYYFGERVFTTPEHTHEGEPDSLRVLELLLENTKWLFPALLSTLPGAIISLALRFDYHLHLANQNEATHKVGNTDPSEELLFYAVPPPASSPDLAEGVLIPHKSPKGFKKPYYTTAFIAWAVFNGVLLALTAACFDGQPASETTCYALRLFARLVERTGKMEVVAIVNFVSMPLVMSVMMGVAVMRGELGRLWGYAEEWRVKKGHGVSLA